MCENELLEYITDFGECKECPEYEVRAPDGHSCEPPICYTEALRTV